MVGHERQTGQKHRGGTGEPSAELAEDERFQDIPGLLAHASSIIQEVRDEFPKWTTAEIAERLTAENKLKQSNELLSGMLQSLDGIIYVADYFSCDTHVKQC